MDFIESYPNASSTDTSSTREHVSDWRLRIRSVQEKNVTPQIVERIKSKAERSKRAMLSAKRAGKMMKQNYVTSACNTVTLRKFKFGKGNEQYDDLSEEHTSRTKRLQASLQTSAAASAPVGYDDEDEDLDNLECEVINALGDSNETASAPPAMCFGNMNQAEQVRAQNALSDEITSLLQQLVVEPTDEAELTAKFVLFENFLATVVTIREQTLQFWADNEEQFQEHAALHRSASRDVRKIDSVEAMGIQDDPRKWFVYGMTAKANQNSRAINNVLGSLRSRLELLGEEDLGECPFCLDELQPGSFTLLGCCHRTCKDCWQHWTELQGTHAFCPLCRHEEFVQNIFE